MLVRGSRRSTKPSATRERLDLPLAAGDVHMAPRLALDHLSLTPRRNGRGQ